MTIGIKELVPMLRANGVRRAVVDGNEFEFFPPLGYVEEPERPQRAEPSPQWMHNGAMTMQGQPPIVVDPNKTPLPTAAIDGYRWDVHLVLAGRASCGEAGGTFLGDPDNEALYRVCAKCKATQPADPRDGLFEGALSPMCPCHHETHRHFPENGLCMMGCPPELCASTAAGPT